MPIGGDRRCAHDRLGSRPQQRRGSRIARERVGTCGVLVAGGGLRCGESERSIEAWHPFSGQQATARQFACDGALARDSLASQGIARHLRGFSLFESVIQMRPIASALTQSASLTSRARRLFTTAGMARNRSARLSPLPGPAPRRLNSLLRWKRSSVVLSVIENTLSIP